MFLAAYQACKLNDIFHYDVMMCLAMQNYKAAVVKSGRDEKKTRKIRAYVRIFLLWIFFVQGVNR